MRINLLNWKLIIFALLIFLAACVPVPAPIHNADWKWKAYQGSCDWTADDVAAGDKPLTPISDIAIDPNSNRFFSFETDEEDKCWFFHTYILVKNASFGEILPEVDDVVTWNISGYNYSEYTHYIESNTTWLIYDGPTTSQPFRITVDQVCYEHKGFVVQLKKIGVVRSERCYSQGTELTSMDLTFKKGAGNTVSFFDIASFDIDSAFVRGPVYELWFKLEGYNKPNYFNLIFPAESNGQPYKLKDYVEIDSEGDFDGDNFPFMYYTGGTDCNDVDPNMNPGRPEICFDGKDNDCSKNIDEKDGLHGNITCDQEQNQFTCEGTSGYEFIPNKGSFLQGAGCCGDDDILDPGFEVPYLKAWQTGDDCDETYCYLDGQISHSGSTSFRLVGNNKTLFQNSQSLGPNYYNLSFWVKTKDAGLKIQGESGSITIPQGTNDWRHYYLINVQPNFTTFTNNQGIVWIDDVHVSGFDLGRVLTNINNDHKNLCLANGDGNWEWKDATEHGFEIERSPALDYDVISDSLNWFGCNDSGILPGGINTLNAYQILTYSGLEAVEPIGLGEAFGQYDSGTNDIALLPAEQWNSGLSIFTAAGGGIPSYCSNKVFDIGLESDVDCGGSCNPCIDRKNCTTNDDCLSGNCDPDTKQCAPKTVPVNLLQKSYMARRFICSVRNTENIFTECAGFNLGAAKNINLRDKIRRAGNLLSTIFEFVKAADNVNYAIVFGLPTTIAGDYYVMPFYVEKDADNKITDWSPYNYLEFDIAYAKDIDNYKIAIFNNYDNPWEKTFEKALNQGTTIKVFDNLIKNYIVNQPQEGRWLHVKIPLDSITKDRITFIALYANKNQVDQSIVITHPNLNPGAQYRNVIAVDRIALTKTNEIDNKYCAAFPTQEDGDYWINGTKLDDNIYMDVMNFPVGKIICDQTPSWGWTGTKCCGDDAGENYTDTRAGCLRGSIVRNNSIFNLTVPNDVISLLSMNGKFQICGNKKSQFPVPTSQIAGENVTEIENTSCNSLGAWYCDFDSFWKDKYRIAGEIINTSKTLPPDIASAVKGCCPQNYCWSGPEFIVGVPANETGSKGCVPDQSQIFAIGDEHFFNSSLKYGKDGDNYITGNDVAYRCVKGTWNVAIPKWNPEHTKQGYCERFDQCFLNESIGCVDSGYWKGEKYCESKKQNITIGTVNLSNIDFSNWTTRTKLVAYELFKIANSSAASRANFTIYCDSFDKVLNEYKYYQDYFAGKSAEELIMGDKITTTVLGTTIETFKCPNQGQNGTLPCTNHWCVLRYEKDDGGERIVIGTSLNLEPDTRKYLANSILKLFPESASTLPGADHYDFCDNATLMSNETGNFFGCLGRTSSASPGNKANLWFNNRTQVLLYSVEPFTIETEAPTFFENFFRNPILTIIQLFTGNPSAPAFDFVRELSDFNKIYVSVLNNKKIMGAIEKVGAEQGMIVKYENLGIDITKEPINLTLDCGNPFENNICTYNETENIATYATKSANKFDLFDELTTRTRLK